ncbi:MAG: TerB family tellurite resistance protein [Cellvibrionales bacterium TMED148]|mgnify:FL=1|nr:hypothetical protein [Porticoccaceae bacterium]RPG88126.1 MAG: TerB family tellurite resistance protein [Cellvibrionales bacterium TMED148]|tara:strand:- start:349 stop:810 length:462 start_codon:yes stop_codon:yes gene_type:complete
MFKHIKDYFEKQILNAQEDVPENRPEELATAALLIEVMIVDGNLAEQELASISRTLQTLLNLSAEDVGDLVALSQAEVDQATSLYEFTSLINQHFDLNQKMDLMTSMWRVAFADGHLDKHEENIIRKVSELIHLRHGEYIKCKLAAKSVSDSE